MSIVLPEVQFVEHKCLHMSKNGNCVMTVDFSTFFIDFIINQEMYFSGKQVLS